MGCRWSRVQISPPRPLLTSKAPQTCAFPDMPFIYDVDIVGSCNLRCPSSPVGNTGPAMAREAEAARASAPLRGLLAKLIIKAPPAEPHRSKGMMNPELFERSLE